MAEHGLRESIAPIRILVAEDDMFQRLNLMDLLDFCNYEVTDVENGLEAKEELLKNGNSYDLVLLDLMMPEMDGLETLIFIKDHPKLKDLPVVMMSSDRDMDTVALCMAKGAKDYLMKPVRIPTAKGLKKFVRLQGPTERQSPSQRNYIKIDELGHGAHGYVNLVRNKNDGKFYAMKTVIVAMMTQRQKKMAENEVTLLKALNSPAIIKCFDSYTEPNKVITIMEYAEKGSLAKLIETMKSEGKRFGVDELLEKVSHLIIGLLTMHLKNIIHRDIKPENIFIGEDDIFKLGDFGIAKQGNVGTTFAGTPLYMAPDVWLRNSYSLKADIWSLGCTIYEMVALKPPFMGEEENALREQILNKEPEPLSKETDPKIKMLVSAMLQKNPIKRPSIWDIAEIEFVTKLILDFGTKHDCLDFIETIIEPSNRKTEEQQIVPFNLEELTNLIRDSLPRKTIKTGILSTEQNCVSGDQLSQWIAQKMGIQSKEKINKIFEAMLEKGLLYDIFSGESTHKKGQKSQKFKNSSENYYKFYQDREHIACNIMKTNNEKIKPAMELSIDLICKTNELLHILWPDHTKDQPKNLSSKEIKENKTYREFKLLLNDLQNIQFGKLTKDETIATFLNIYQAMYIDSLMNSEKLSQEPGFIESVLNKLCCKRAPPKFYYKVGGLSFTLFEIQHGILRGNKKPPNSIISRVFSSDDPRILMARSDDLRIIFLFREDGSLPMKVTPFTGDELDKELDEYCLNYCNQNIVFKPSEKEFVLPEIFQRYHQDFGSDKKLVDMILRYKSIKKELDQYSTVLDEENLSVSYRDSNQ